MLETTKIIIATAKENLPTIRITMVRRRGDFHINTYTK